MPIGILNVLLKYECFFFLLDLLRVKGKALESPNTFLYLIRYVYASDTLKLETTFCLNDYQAKLNFE